MRETHGATRDTNVFDALRLFAALIVVLQHSLALGGASAFGTAVSVINGVGVFFVISGMLVYRSGVTTRDRSGGWSTFFLNRYLRIAPGLLAFAVIAPVALLVGGAISLRQLFHPDFVVWLGSTALLLPNSRPEFLETFGRINGPLYTIPAEVSFYLLVPMLVTAARRWGVARVVVVFIAAATALEIAAIAVGGPMPNLFHHLFIERAAFFGLGILVGRYGRRVPGNWWWTLGAFALYCAIRLIAPTSGIGLWTPFLTIAIAIPLAYVVAFVGWNGPRLLTVITDRIGDLSFGVYIWHMLVVFALVHAGWAGHWAAIPGIMLISLTIAAASWRFVERPALRLKRISGHPVDRLDRTRRLPS